MGLIPTVRAYLEVINCDKDARAVVDNYLNLIQARVDGSLLTLASWLRKFVSVHPSYDGDSVLKSDVFYDVIETCVNITNGTIQAPQLLGPFVTYYQNVDSKTTLPPGERVLLKGGGDAFSLDLNNQSACEAFRQLLRKHNIASQQTSTPQTQTP